jgi:hypothetical protein
MNFFKNLFSSTPKSEPEKNPENTRLIFLLNNYGQNRSQANYTLVMKELLEGNSFLILPTINGETAIGDWKTANEDTKLKLTSVFNLDGLKVLGAFSNEKSLLAWSKKPTPYTAVKSSAVLKMCEEISVSRIVINSGSESIFVVERNNKTEQINIEDGTTIQIGTPARPLNETIIKNLVLNFRPIENILEAYQYMQTRNNEASITIGLKLSSYSDNAKKAVLFAVQTALHNETSKTFVDILFLETDDRLDMVKNIEDALFYKKT